MTALQIALLLVSYVIGPASLDDGRCSHCAATRLASSPDGTRYGRYQAVARMDETRREI